jgi:signal transduction histidine kinase
MSFDSHNLPDITLVPSKFLFANLRSKHIYLSIIEFSEMFCSNIFDIFQTLADPQKKNTGIGLSIVKKIVEAQGGNISIESELGAGTTFRSN